MLEKSPFSMGLGLLSWYQQISAGLLVCAGFPGDRHLPSCSQGLCWGPELLLLCQAPTLVLGEGIFFYKDIPEHDAGSGEGIMSTLLGRK